MVVNVAEAVEFVRDIARNEKVKVTVTQSLKGGMVVGACAALGGLCLGPPGLAVGGAVGGLAAAASARGKFLPLPVVIANLSAQEKRRLAQRVERIVQDFNVTDVAALAAMLAGNQNLKQKVVQELIQFMTQEMQLAIA